MNKIITALNLTEGAVLTLEKIPDRMEFEALTILAGEATAEKKICGINGSCSVCPDCPSLCSVCLDCGTYGQGGACPGKGMP